MIRSISRTLSLAVVGIALAPLASAQTSVSHAVPYQSPVLSQPWSTTFTVPRFDPSLGHLSAVVLNLDGWLGGSSRMENVSAGPIYAQAATRATLILSTPSPLPAEFAVPEMTDAQNGLPAFDGTLDFAGTSGITNPFVPTFGGPGTDYSQTVLMNPSHLALFFGPAGAPGTISFAVQATQSVDNQTGPELVADPLATIRGTFRVDYYYDTLPGPVCTSAAHWGGCPCTPLSSPMNGCANSVYTAGAGLTRSGVASISGDTLALSATNLSGTTAIFVQSVGLNDPGVFFGDGLRCLTGATIRLGASPISAGASSYPQGAQLSMSVRGAIAAPGMRYYQTYYRNVASFCTPAAFNLSSGQAVLWQA
jgi:hypothetical protein